MKRKIKRIALLGLCMCFLFGCQSAKEAKEQGELRLFLTVSQGDDFRNALISAAEETAKKEGVLLTASDANGDLERQIYDIKNAVKEGYDAILCAPVNADTALEIESIAGSIPVVFYNSCPEERWLKEDQYIYVGSNEGDAGSYQGEYVLEKLKGKSEINVAILQGEKGHSATKGRVKALLNKLNASGKKINYVFQDFADWDQEKAKKLFQLFLTTNQPYDCVLCNNDAMALGVIEACREAGIDDSKAMILGIDATESGCRAIQEGAMQFTVFQSAQGQGEYAVLAAVALAGGGSIKELEYAADDAKYVWIPYEKVTKSNVGNYS